MHNQVIHMHDYIHDRRKNGDDLFQIVHGEFHAKGNILFGYNLGLTEKGSLPKVPEVI